MQNHSRDNIIDCVQAAGKLSDIKLYYFNLLIENLFAQTLSEIKRLLNNQGLDYSIHFNNSSNLEQKFTKQLIQYLSIANINLNTNHSINTKTHHFFVSSSKSSKAEQKEQNTVILALEKYDSEITNENTRHIDFTSPDNFYLATLQLITHIMADNSELHQIVKKFEIEYHSIQNSWNGTTITEVAQEPINKPKEPLQKTIFHYGLLICVIIFLCIWGMQSLNYNLLKQTNTTSNESEKTNVIPHTWNIPRQHIVFVGRETLLKTLEKTLLNNKIDKAKTLAISVCEGLGGTGKTQLALQYIHYTKHPYTMKIWFHGEDTLKLKQNYEEFAHEIGYDKDSQQIDAISYVKKWLTQHPGWLIVIDNVNNYDDIEEFLPETGGYVILTTRKRDWPESFNITPIDVMTEEEAIDTLDTLMKDNKSHELKQKKELAALLGYLPLALSEAGSYIHQNNISVADYLELYKTHALELLSHNSFTKGVKHASVAVTWNISLEAIAHEASEKNEAPIAIELITMCSYLAPDKISKNLLLSWLKYAHPELLSPDLILNKQIELL